MTNPKKIAEDTMEFATVKPYPGMIITESVRFLPGEYDFHDGEGIVIAADGITVEGNGAILRGGCEKAADASHTKLEAFGYGANAQADNGRALGYCGTGITVEGRAGVTIRSLALSGFDQGARLTRCKSVRLENCDFSDCFTDPDWGWDEHGWHGAILMIDSHRCTIAHCRANRVWDALHLRHSHDNLICDNDFSHTSDTGLKLWHACRNTIRGNDFSYGIRIAPGEVHARDSSCVLIESGSDGNYFYRNDMTHGGDGLFIRVLNGWMSCHNLFEENDCSYANNNAVEAWANHNTYIRNKANHSSYGFWLGNSNDTVLSENEAAFNGAEYHNAPEAFGNAGIAIVNGSGTHSVLRGNWVHDNCGPGIAIRNTPEAPSMHWILEGNRICDNRDAGKYRGHGIYCKNARLIYLSANEFSGNQGEDVCPDGHVASVVELSGAPTPIAPLRVDWPGAFLRAGQPCSFAAQGAPGLRWLWDFGDDTTSPQQNPQHTYSHSGMYTVCATADNGARAAMAGQTLFVLPRDYAPFSIERVETDARLASQSPLTLKSENGKEHMAKLIGQGEIADALVLHLQYFSDADTDWDKATRYPVITLWQDERNGLLLRPQAPLLEMMYAADPEQREAGRLYEIPLAGNDVFAAEPIGHGVHGTVRQIDIRYGGCSEAHATLVINALGFARAIGAPAQPALDITGGRAEILLSGAPRGEASAPVSPPFSFEGDRTARITFASGESGYYGVVFDMPRLFDRVEAVFYQNLTHTTQAQGETLPAAVWVECLSGGQWHVLEHTRRAPEENAPTLLDFPVQDAEGVRVAFQAANGPVSLHRFSVYHRAAAPIRLSCAPASIAIDRFEVKLNKEFNGNGAPLGDLTAAVYELSAAGELTNRLFSTVVPRDRVIPYVPLAIETPGLSLVEGTRYALALGQTQEAASRTEGDYYRWIAGPVDCAETFGIFTDGQTKPSDYDWGTAWLRAVAGNVAAQLVHTSEHVGTRFGIAGMQCRYQTFCAPWRHQCLCDGDTRTGMTLRAPLSIALERPAACVFLYALEATPPLTITSAAGERLAGPLCLSPGKNAVPLAESAATELLLECDGAVLSEIEVIPR